MIDSTPARVTGIVDDVKEFSLDAPDRGTAYMNFTQAPSWMLGPTSTFVLRAPGDGHRLGPAMRAAVTQVDHDLPIAFFRTMRDMQNEQLLAPRLGAMLLVSFGGSAGLLALLGLAGVLAFAVSQRLPEIGVRMALGATQRQVSGGIIREASILIATGLLLGLAGALGTNRLLRTLLFEVGPGDPGVLASIAALTAAMALVASWYPAWRAARVDPLIVLRADS
jgi:ABC-type antimicrobial peptide transport system permease subunit